MEPDGRRRDESKGLAVNMWVTSSMKFLVFPGSSKLCMYFAMAGVKVSVLLEGGIGGCDRNVAGQGGRLLWCWVEMVT